MSPHPEQRPVLSRLDLLQKLFNTLPRSLPLNPSTSQYDFKPDFEDCSEEPYHAINTCLEQSFQTHQIPKRTHLKITERGLMLDA
jgi:hypothetical protein